MTAADLAAVFTVGLDALGTVGSDLHRERAFLRNEMASPHLDVIRSRRLRNLSSLAFGGPDLRTAYLGCLLGESLVTFRTPLAGLPPSHWDLET